MLLQSVLRQLSSAPAEAGSDAALLRRFADGQDHAAFAVLVQRHGGLVWGVCKQMLPNEADAEDAFQAAFLVLLRDTGSAQRARALGGWLHGVAVKVCLKARRTEARKRKREERGAKPEVVPEADLLGSDWTDLHAAVHEEVRKLPDAHRTAFVLCDLQGVRQHDAAARLGWKIGTLTGRLSRARQQLMKRLTARGLAPAVGVGLATGLSAGAGLAAPAALADKALTLTTGHAIPAAVLNLSKHILEGTLMKVKLLAATVLTAGLALTAAGWLATADAQSGAGGAGGGGGLPGGGPAGPPGVGGLPGGGEGTGGGLGRPGTPGTGLPGGDGAGVGTGSIAAKPQPRVEHVLVDLPDTEKKLAELFAKQQADGWEFAGQVEFGGKYQKLAFKRPTPRSGGGGTGTVSSGTTTTAPVGTGTGPRIGGMGTTESGTKTGPGTARPTPGATVPAGSGDGEGPGGPPAKPLADLRIVRLRNAAAADIANVLTRLFGQDTTVVAEPMSNTLLIRGSAKNLDELQAVIQKLEEIERPAPPTLPGPGGAGPGGPGIPGGRGPGR